MNGSWQDEHYIKIIDKTYLTHDVIRLRTTKPKGYQFIPGEATDIVINQPEWKGNRHAFTFTGLNEWDFLEFSIKINKHRKGFTYKIEQLEKGDELIIHDSFGAFRYRGAGVFIAGGSGITPFIAILRQLNQDGNLKSNQLFYSNKTVKDIILKEEFTAMLGEHFVNIITKENTREFQHHRIGKHFLLENIHDFSQYFYICGKIKMMDEIQAALISLGVQPDKIITEMKFD